MVETTKKDLYLAKTKGRKDAPATYMDICQKTHALMCYQPEATLTQSNKFQKFTARMRTDLELARKSPRFDYIQVETLESEIRYLLDNRNISYPPALEKKGLNMDTPFQDRKNILENKVYKRTMTENEKKLIKFMEKAQQKSNQVNWRFRIAEEAEQKRKEGWYPFFITITVDPKLIDSENMWKKGRKWQSMVKRLSKIASNEMGHPPFWKKTKKYPYRPITDYLTYASVLEHGKSREHHHVHALIWLREIPSKWKICPNRNVYGKYRTNNRCKELETYWKLGKSEANYFRSTGDIWEIKHNFILPLKDGKPMQVASTKAAGNYVTKYLQKDHKEWQHRMKTTRNLGMKRLKTLIMSMKNHQVKALTMRAHNHQLCLSLSLTHTVPLGLVRRVAKQIHFFNQYRTFRLNTMELMMITTKPYIRMLRSAADGARPDRMPFAEFYDWVTRHLPDQRGYCKETLIESHKILGNYFKREVIRVKPIKLGANNNGYT